MKTPTPIKVIVGFCFALILFCIVSLFTGCVSTQNTDGTVTRKFDAERTAQVLENMLPPAVKLAVAKEPKSMEWITSAKFVICTLADSGKVTPQDLKSALAVTHIEEIQTPEIQAVIESVFGIYKAAYADSVTAGMQPQMATVLRGICAGLSEGLN